jgi:hypothetical protein
VSGRRSRATIVRELALELGELRVFQLFARKLGPDDVVYASAQAFDSNDHIVEAKASALTLPDALEQLLSNLDQATAPED